MWCGSSCKKVRSIWTVVCWSESMSGPQHRSKAVPSHCGRKTAGPGADYRLGCLLPRPWMLIVAKLAKCDGIELTPRRFWLTIAKRGGYVARKGDGPPGWSQLERDPGSLRH